MARPKRTAAAAAQTGAAQNRTAEVKKTAEVKSTAEVKTAEDVKKADEPAVKKAYAKSHPGTVIKSMELYISPEQNAAYYVVNGEGSDDFRIDL